MEAFSTFRRRRNPKRDEYRLLHEDSDGSQYSYSTNPAGTGDSSRYSAGPYKLCDKCWLCHTRSKASKRCMQCQQNLCTRCADKDENRRPWWLPACLEQCMRFLFCYVYFPHTIVDINDLNKDQGHWALRAETSSINRIPRINQDSLRLRNKTRDNVSQNGRGSNISDSRDDLIDRDNQQSIMRSKSHEETSCRLRRHPRVPKRSISLEKINKRLNRERRERDKIYHRNWDNDIWDQTRRAGVRPAHADKPFMNKVKGKDVDIVISGSEMKLTINDDKKSGEVTNKKRHEHKEGFFRRKSKTKTKDEPYLPYTEEVFSENPIWFKRDSGKKNKTNTGKKSNDSIPCHQAETVNKGNNNEAFESVQQDKTKDYVVEEPPDQCPICLEDLPDGETRILSCSHLLHTKCLKHYLRGTDNLDFGVKCPMCNRITEIRNYYAPKELWYREIPVSSQV